MKNKNKKEKFIKQKLPRTFKRDVKTILVIISLLDGEKYNQTEIKDNINRLIDHPIQFYKDPIIGWNAELEQSIEMSGRHIDHSTVSRIVKDLKLLGVIEKESVQRGQGAASSIIQLKVDINAVLQILTKFQNSIFSDFSFLWLGTQLINSNYGKKLINKEFIEGFDEKIGNKLTNTEKQRLLELIKISPSALINFILSYIVSEELSEWKKYELFRSMTLSMLNDFKVIGFNNLPVAAEISLIFNKENIPQEDPYEINNERINIKIY